MVLSSGSGVRWGITEWSGVGRNMLGSEEYDGRGREGLLGLGGGIRRRMKVIGMGKENVGCEVTSHVKREK